MARINYCVAKISEAILEMATSTEGLQARLSKVMAKDMSSLHIEDFPLHLIPQFRYLQAVAAKDSEAGDERAVQATIGKMSDDEARNLIEKIVALFDDVLEHYYREQFGRQRPT